MKLYISDNKVIVTEGFNGVVPVKYFQKIRIVAKERAYTISDGQVEFIFSLNISMAICIF